MSSVSYEITSQAPTSSVQHTWMQHKRKFFCSFSYFFFAAKYRNIMIIIEIHSEPLISFGPAGDRLSQKKKKRSDALNARAPHVVIGVYLHTHVHWRFKQPLDGPTVKWPPLLIWKISNALVARGTDGQLVKGSSTGMNPSMTLKHTFISIQLLCLFTHLLTRLTIFYNSEKKIGWWTRRVREVRTGLLFCKLIDGKLGSWCLCTGVGTKMSAKEGYSQIYEGEV